MKRIRLLAIALAFCISFNACHKKERLDTPEIQIANNDFKIIKVYNHSTNSFTEGLFIDKGMVFESTGAPENLPQTKSEFGILDLKTGAIHTKAELDRNFFFGEGIAKCKNKIYQLTYKNKIGFIYDATTFQKTGSFQFESSEGWGLTNVEDELLIMSDGSNNLTFLDPINLQIVKKLAVFENNSPVLNLNELEYVNGYIYANIFTTNKMVKIDVSSGNVVKTIDCTALYNDAKSRFPGSLEMNGIAYDATKDTFLVTGKMWPVLYEIKIDTISKSM